MATISLQYPLFLILFLAGYWTLQSKSLRGRNLWLLLGCYIFYGWGDWRFLALLIGLSGLTWWIGKKIGEAIGERRRVWFQAGILISLGTLGFFKYYDFFAVSVARGLSACGLATDAATLNLLLPLGLSYFSLKAISYLFEVYKERFPPAGDPVAYFTYLAFFPQIVAGPIDRPANLLHQIGEEQHPGADDLFTGLKLAVWGLFKKAVVADNLAASVQRGFDGYAALTGMELALTALFFSVQLYCDFSGYTDIANGVARLMGFKPADNFAQPYFARDIAEFWRRWHISLTGWFRDYLFYPLGGGMGSRWKALRNTLATFTLSGLWHGANWTFVAWGFLNGLLFTPIILGWQKTHTKQLARGRLLPHPLEAIRITGTFLLVTMTFVFFRADTLAQAVGFLGRMISEFRFQNPHHLTELFFIGLWLVPEWIGRGRISPLELKVRSRFIRWMIYSLLVAAILLRGSFGETPFIYQQF